MTVQESMEYEQKLSDEQRKANIRYTNAKARALELDNLERTKYVEIGDYLKTDKPSKPVIETEHFRVEGNAIISKDCFNTNSIFDLDLRKYQEFPMSIHKVDNDCTQYLSANAHREIAEILDRLDSAR